MIFNKISNYPAQSQAIMNKMKSTCLDRYGVEYSLQSPEIDSKRQETWHIRYGGNPSSNEEIIKKRKATNFERYGYQAGYPQSLEYMTIQFNKIKERFAGKIQPLFDQNNYHGINSKCVYKWRCVKCGNEFEQDIHYTYIDENEHLLPRCLKCYPYLTGFSKSEKSLLEYIKQIYNGEIIENDRTLLKQYELDIVLPELKLAIQFNGVYWHSNKDKNYHLNKTELCEKAGYRLIHIWQDEWNNNKEILLNKLKSIIEDNEIIEDNILDRCWYSILQFDNYEILQPEIIIRDGYQLYNCGYIELI